MDAAVGHSVSCSLMLLELALCTTYTDDFISSFIDKQDDIPGAWPHQSRARVSQHVQL